MKASNLIGLLSTIAISFMLTFSAAYSYNEVYGSGSSVAFGNPSANYSFNNITVSIEASVSNGGLIPLGVSLVGQSAEVAAGAIGNLFLYKVINFSAISVLGYPTFPVKIPLNLSGSLSSMFFDKLLNFSVGTILLQVPFKNFLLNVTGQSNGVSSFSGLTQYMWSFAFTTITGYILNDGIKAGSVTITDLPGSYCSIAGNANLTGNQLNLAVGNLEIPLSVNGNNQLILSNP